MFHIDRFDFDERTPKVLGNLAYDGTETGTNWPVVYVINNEKEAYVGETTSASTRAKQHLDNAERRRLTEIRIISDLEFNKSVILDLESFLIKHMSADGKFMLQNGNSGLQNHNYYNRERYEEEFERIWDELCKLEVVSNTLDEIRHSELFKYSPYKTLMNEQKTAEVQILKILADTANLKNGSTVLVSGGAGTGKTILAVYLMKLLADVKEQGHNLDLEMEDFLEEDLEFIFSIENLEHFQKIGIVIPQKSLRTSLKKVFSSIKSLSPDMVYSQSEVAKEYLKTGEKFDLLIVDEAHRLSYAKRGNLQNNKEFNDINKAFGYGRKEFTQLDWIMESSKYQVLFRDELQTVRPTDIDGTTFAKILEARRGNKVESAELQTQWRCKGAKAYIDYIKNIFSQQMQIPRKIENYDLRMYDDVDRMINDIKEKDKEYKLCRNVAGYAWYWNRKNIEEPTIKIQGYEYIWNRKYDNWIVSPTAIDEIGCIHTVQGYDLNYAGIIIGPDLFYDKTSKTIKASADNYFDALGKSGIKKDEEALRELITDVYITLMTRGIEGTYVYVCDDALREYMRPFFEVNKIVG